jgi:hypothetical protein
LIKKTVLVLEKQMDKKKLGITLAKNPHQPQTIIAIFNQLVTAN